MSDSAHPNYCKECAQPGSKPGPLSPYACNFSHAQCPALVTLASKAEKCMLASHSMAHDASECMCIQIEVRKAQSGQLILKDSMAASVAAIAKGDYRGDGADQVVVCAVNGEVRPIYA